MVIGFDGLSLFFLFTFQLLSLAGSLYAIGYLRHYIERGLSVRAHLWFFTLLIVSMQLLAVVHNALVFLMVWEAMAIGAYFSIVFDKEKPEVRRGGFWYFVATHASALLLYVCFLTLHEITGSWNFEDFARHAVLRSQGARGHPAHGLRRLRHQGGLHAVPRLAAQRASGRARARLRAALGHQHQGRHLWNRAADTDSARVNSRYAAYGWGLLAVSLVSAVLGVWYALAQHDIKRLLAYHSVENIGIIGMGLSVAWLGRCYALPELVVLGFAGALLHTLNHAIFKGLLFFGAGNVSLHAARRRHRENGRVGPGHSVYAVGRAA